MTFIAISGQSDLSLVEQIVGQMKQLIDRNVMRHGSRVSSIRAFARDHGISPFTVAEAYERLVAESYFQSRPRSGYFVTRPPRNEEHETASRPSPTAPENLWHVHMRSAAEPETIPASGDTLPDSWLDRDLIKSSFRSVAIKADSTFVRDEAPYGYAPLCALVQSKLLGMGICTSLNQLLLTNGVSHAFDLLIRCFLQPGDRVLVEDPGHFQLFNNLRLRGIEAIPVSRLADGPDLKQVEVLAREHKPAFIFIQSILHDPTGSCITPANAHSLLRLAEQHGFYIVENDSNAELVELQPPRIATLDQLNKVFFVQSLSNTLSVGADVGFISGPSDLIHVLCLHKIAAGFNGKIDQRIVYSLLTEGRYRRSVERLRSKMTKAARLTCAALEDNGFETFCRPQGGKFIWVRSPRIEDSKVISGYAAMENICIVPGSMFRSSMDPTPWFRLNIAYCLLPRVARFLSELGTLHSYESIGNY